MLSNMILRALNLDDDNRTNSSVSHDVIFKDSFKLLMDQSMNLSAQNKELGKTLNQNEGGFEDNYTRFTH